MKFSRILPLAALILSLAACQQEAAKQDAATASANPDAKPGISVTDGRLVLPAVKGNPGAAYFTVANGGDKANSIATIAIDGAGKAEMHETTGGSMAMMLSAEVAPGKPVTFGPGGKHVMVFDLTETLKAGGSTEMTLTFTDGDKISAPLRIEAAGSAGSSDEDGDDMAGMDHGDMH